MELNSPLSRRLNLKMCKQTVLSSFCIPDVTTAAKTDIPVTCSKCFNNWKENHSEFNQTAKSCSQELHCKRAQYRTYNTCIPLKNYRHEFKSLELQRDKVFPGKISE